MTEERRPAGIYLPKPLEAELGQVGPMMLLQANARGLPVVVMNGGKPVGYYAPFNGDVDSFRGPQQEA